MRALLCKGYVASALLMFSLGGGLSGCNQKTPVTPPVPMPTPVAAPETGKDAAKVAEGVKPTLELATGPLAGGSDDSDPGQPKVDGPAGPKPPLPPVPAEVAPPASPVLDGQLPLTELTKKIDTYFQGHVGRRVHIQTDKPLYKPGETIWLKVWDLTARALAADTKATGMFVELVSPKGAVTLKRKIKEQRGMAQADFPLPANIVGGEYTLRVRTLDGVKSDRPVIVSTYEAPRLKMQLEFVKKAYGGGDEVTATIAVKRPTGEPLANHSLNATVRLDGEDLPKVALSTDAQGEGLVRFTLPPEIGAGDGLLTILADDGGLTESIAKRIPIVVKHMQVAIYPEGGELVSGLPGRVYVEAKTPLGKPADITARLIDEASTTVAKFQSVRDGLGRVDFTPKPGIRYYLEVDKPVGVVERYPVPAARDSGCVLHSFDDLDGQLGATRVGIHCTESRKVIVSAMLREKLIDAAALQVKAGEQAVAYLEPRGQGSEVLAKAQGVARVTLFDEQLLPLAERLVYRNRRARLDVKVTPSKKSYVPREQVELQVQTQDPLGNPVPADLALSVVDDTVLSFADDKTGHMLSRIYLEPELPGKVEEPNFYFDLSEARSAMAMDLLMGTRGWRKFEWQPVLNNLVAQASTGSKASRPHKTMATGAQPESEFADLRKKGAVAMATPPPPPPVAPPADQPAPDANKAKRAEKDAVARDKNEQQRPVAVAMRAAAEAPETKAMPKREAPMAPPKAPAPMAAKPQAMAEAAPMEAPAKVMQAAPAKKMAMAGGRAKAAMNRDDDALFDMADRAPAGKAAMDKEDLAMGGLARGPALGLRGAGMGGAGLGDDAIGRLRRARPVETWAPVRVFPVPKYKPDYAGPRTDFRETIYWAPAVQTGQDGKATVRFTLSDAITSFRVQTEGVGAGAAGRDEAVIKASLPFSMAVKLPLEVSEGDKLELPLLLTNERDLPVDVKLDASFGKLLTLDKPVQRTRGNIAASARDTLYYPLTVTGKKGLSEVRFAADAGGLTDEFVRQVQVSPRGFPQNLSKSGRLKDSFSHEFDVGDFIAATGEGQVKLYTSTLHTLVAGMEGMLREPSGCFEQTSSVNYPNVMILRFMKEQGVYDGRIMGKASRLLDDGYKKLIGYETPTKGYEWFGGSPGHEALSAYGLVEFSDMRGVYRDVDKAMLARTADWLRSRRDGKGGYLRDSKALDSFGNASKEVTNAYITWSITESKQPGFETEINAAARMADSTQDAYILALSTGTLFNAGRKGEGLAAAKRLAVMQEADGGFKKASHSITRSGGENLQVETTSLAMLAMLKANAAGGNFEDQLEKSVQWMLAHRRGYGAWGATQATVLGLKALTAYSATRGREQGAGKVSLVLNGQVLGTRSYAIGDREPLVFTGLGTHLKQGANKLELKREGTGTLPFSIAMEYRTSKPASSTQAKVALQTVLERTQAKLGESVRMNVTLTNKTGEGQPMTMARVQLPGGLTFQNWQLKELREKGLIAFYETRAREVNLYLRQMLPNQTVQIPLDLVAFAPGQYTSQASTAYLYYTDEHKVWVEPTSIRIEP